MSEQTTLDYIVDELVGEGLITMVAGLPKSYKSWLVHQMAIDVSMGHKFLDKFPVKKCAIIYIDTDTKPGILYPRLNRMTNYKGVKLSDLPIEIITDSKWNLMDSKPYGDLVNRIRGRQINNQSVLVILDCLQSITTGMDLNQPVYCSKIMQKIKNLVEYNNTDNNLPSVSVIFLHHMSQHKLTKRGDENSIKDAIMSSTYIISNTDAALCMMASPMKKVTHFLCQGVRMRTKYDPEKEISFAISLIDDNEDKVHLKYLGYADGVPSEDAYKVYKMFPDKERSTRHNTYTVDELHKESGKSMKHEAIVNALNELVHYGVVKQCFEPNQGRLSTIKYGISDNFDEDFEKSYSLKCLKYYER